MDACEKLFHENVDDANSICEEFCRNPYKLVIDVLYLTKMKTTLPFHKHRHRHVNTLFYNYGLADICGTENSGKSVIMGVLTTKHGMGECTFTWVTNNGRISTGPERCMVTIDQPGSYNVIIEQVG